MSTIQIKRGDETSVSSHVLLRGEPAVAMDTHKLHIGDGTTAGGFVVEASTGSIKNIIPNKGGLLTNDGTDLVEVPVGTNNQVMISDSSVDQGMKWTSDLSIDNIGLTTTGALTISAGAVTVTLGSHTLASEVGGAPDNLDTINGGVSGRFLLLRRASTDIITLRHGQGNILTPDASNIGLDSVNELVLLQYNGTNWLVVAAWANPLPFSQKGQILTYDGTTPTVVTVGTNNEIIVADSTTTPGIKWTNSISPTKLGLTAPAALTIAGGVVTATSSSHSIASQSGGSTDDLDTINGGTSGQLLLIRRAAADIITIKNGTGNILTPDGDDLSLDSINKVVLLQYNGTNWLIVGGSGSGGGGITELELLAQNAALDSVQTGSSYGSWVVFQTLDFSASVIGGAFWNFKIPSSWNTAENINFDIYYNLNGLDNSKTVSFNLACYVIPALGLPVEVSPTESYSYVLNTGTAQNNKLKTLTEAVSGFKISAANLPTAVQLAIKFSRNATDPVNDTYAGTLQIISIRAYQS